MTLSERTLLAQELHDGLAQDLVAIGYGLDLILGNPMADQGVRIEVRKVRFQVAELTSKLRNEIHDLHRKDGDQFLEQIHRYAKNNFPELTLTVNSTALVSNIDGEKCYQMMRIIGEMLRNVSHHAQSSQVAISISQKSDLLTLEISDDGKGGAQVTDDRFGIVGATQRAEFIGGTFSLTSTLNGTTALLTFPVT